MTLIESEPKRLSRRGFLGGLLVAPVVITTPGLLMPVRSLETFDYWIEIDAKGVTMQEIYEYCLKAWRKDDVLPVFRGGLAGHTNVRPEICYERKTVTLSR